MLRFGLKLLYTTFSQIMLVVIAYQFYFRYAMVTGGIGGTLISNIHPIIWFIFIVELLISLILIQKDLEKTILMKAINV